MRLVDQFISNPVKVAVGVILIVLFGALTIVPPSVAPSPLRAPVQLTPNIDEPTITVTTTWEGASPDEVEREILDKQEEVLKSTSNLRKMTGTARQGQSEVRLEFEVGTDKDIAKQDIANALRRVQYQIPQNEFDNPVISSGETDGENAIAWMILSSDRADVHVPELFTFIDEDVKPFLERVEGVSAVDLIGGREREIRIRVDAGRLAASGITFAELRRAIESQNTNVAAGNSAQGKRDVLIRTMGRFESLDDIRNTVVRVDPVGGPVRVSDVAEVVDTFKKQYSFVRSKGQFVMAMPAYRETDANVIETMEGLRAAIARVNADILRHRGLTLELTQVYDETTYINSAIALVRENIFFGGFLAMAVLLLFLRSLSGTLVVALAIPISVIGTLLIIPLLDRNINVVMLAGLAFAVGMVVDNAIVVLENIFRHREMGKSRVQAASDGATEVWGAVLANSLTTIVVFLPILFVQEEAGQLFRDIAIAISGAVALSLLVSITVIPTLASRLLGRSRSTSSEEGSSRIAGAVGGLVSVINRSWALRLLVVVGMTGASIYGSYLLAPEREYLPDGNQNLIFGFLILPPGYNSNEFARIAKIIEDGEAERGIIGVRRFWEVEDGSQEHRELQQQWSEIVEKFEIDAKLKPQIAAAEAVINDSLSDAAARDAAHEMIAKVNRQIAEWRIPPPPIDNFFFVTFNGICFMGCSSDNPELIRPLKNVLTRSGSAVPDAIPIFFQSSIFKLDAGNSVDMEVRGTELHEVTATAGMLMGACAQSSLYQIEPNPNNFSRERREDQIVPDRIRAGELGLTVEDLGFIIRACGDGRVVGQYREGGRSIDLALTVAGTEDPTAGDNTTQAIANVPISTPTGNVVPLAAACDIVRTTSPQEIRHIETQPAVKLTVRPPEGIVLTEAIATIQGILTDMRGDGFGPGKMKIPPTVSVNLAGNAEKLREVWDSLKWLLGLSLLVVFLLMAGLFESFAYPFVIILTVPLAVVGGFIGLAIVHQWSFSNPEMLIQKLDILTILGFVILLGIVVNNGILIVHQALNFVRAGMTNHDAITQSVRTRVRPIFMTVLTTFFGQLTLVVRSGSGSELYRGVGAVVLGGLIVSTLFTIVVIPAMLSLFMDTRQHVQAWRGKAAKPESSANVPTGSGLAVD